MTGDRVKRLGTCGKGGEARAGLQCSHGGPGSSSRHKGSVDLSYEGDARLSEVSPDGVLRGWPRGSSYPTGGTGPQQMGNPPKEPRERWRRDFSLFVFFIYIIER